jgi:phenylalanine-4-hydroxylase
VSPTTSKLPDYLKKYISEQDYKKYTARDHAVWRFILKQCCAYFERHAVPVYLEGLKKTGISLDKIPRISDMDKCLSRFGWGAVPVKGFIPPAAFLDFQARGVLPIASDMRTAEHIAYTPAPDIVHEAAGHAPVIVDPDYADYLHQYAKMAQKAIFSIGDIKVYEAIRYLSDIKENPDTRPEEIKKAETLLKEVVQSVSHLSEAAKVARMNWWTVEYGLVGKLSSPLIYGAGLLSSIGESQNYLSSKVKKIPLTVDCIHTAYDITEPQPQLFVVPSLDALTPVLKDLEKTLSYMKGGVYGLEEAKKSHTVTTTVLNSGIQISGILDSFEIGSKKQISFVRFSGPSQLSMNENEIKGHGISRHSHGFSSPLGRWKNCEKEPQTLSDSDLKKLGFKRGHNR